MDCLPVDLEDAVDLLIPVKVSLNSLSSRCAQLQSQVWIGGQSLHRGDEALGNGLFVGCIDQDSAGCIKVICRTSPVGRDYRDTAGHGFEDNRSAAFINTR